MRKKSVTEVRPISARALKSALDTLRPELGGSRVLDLFAGQGRFGRGALEEGAARVVLVERDRRRAEELRASTARYGERAFVAARDALVWLEEAAGVGERFDVVFADPPFPLWSAGLGDKLLPRVVSVLERPAIFLVKHPTGMVISGASFGLLPWKTTEIGESGLSYFTHGE